MAFIKKCLPVAVTLALVASAFSVLAPRASFAEDVPDRGEIIIKNVQNGDSFTAVRVIESTYDDSLIRTPPQGADKNDDGDYGITNGIIRDFAQGFSYGDNADTDATDGMNSYLALTEDSAKSKAADKFATQYKENVAQMEELTVIAANHQAVFENLPMGQYIIIGTSVDDSRLYQTMLAYVEPTFDVQQNKYTFDAFVVKTPKYKPVKGPILEIDKVSDKESIYRYANVGYTVTVKPSESSSIVSNVKITDELDADSVAQGMKLNRDVKVVYGDDGADIPAAQIEYRQSDAGNIIGYDITLSGDYMPDKSFVVTYTANTEDLSDDPTIVNVAKASCDDADEVTDTVVLTSDEEDLADEMTPLDRAVKNAQGMLDEVLTQTGDTFPYIIGGVALVAALVIVLVVRMRRKNR